MALMCVFTKLSPKFPPDEKYPDVVCGEPAPFIVDGNSLCRTHMLEYRANGGRTKDQIGGH